MEIFVNRSLISANDTFGELVIPDLFQCDTGEPTNRLIPSGRYRIDLTYSPRFKRVMPLICDVPHRSGIRIHCGNVPSKDSTGCILVGTYDPRFCHLVRSSVNFEHLMEILVNTKEDIFITIS